MDSIITGMTGMDEEFKVGYISDIDIISIIAVKCVLPIYLNGLKSTQIWLLIENDCHCFRTNAIMCMV